MPSDRKPSLILPVAVTLSALLTFYLGATDSAFCLVGIAATQVLIGIWFWKHRPESRRAAKLLFVAAPLQCAAPVFGHLLAAKLVHLFGGDTWHIFVTSLAVILLGFLIPAVVCVFMLAAFLRR